MIREIPVGRAWWGLMWPLYDPSPDETARYEGAWFRFKAGKAFRGVSSWDQWDETAREWRKQTETEAKQALVDQGATPILLSYLDGKKYWIYKDRVYSSDPALTYVDVQALLDAKEMKRQRTVERARVVVSTAPASASTLITPGRMAIPGDVKMFVWQRDGGACVECGSKEELEFDHIIPLAMGGANTARNLQLLCALCNQSKGGNLV